MSDKSLLITGCSSGIGLDAARGLRARGWRVFAACRQAEDCARLQAEGFDAPQMDYTASDSLAAGLAEVLEQTGGTLHALINNGAHATPGALEDMPTDALRALFEANFFGWHDLTRQVIPVMRRQGHGRIVCISSVLGFVAYPWRGAYVASKFALEGWADTLRLEMRDTPIHVSTINPGPITTRFRENAIPHFERWIAWEHSPRAAQYRAILHRLYEDRGPDRFELPPEAVTRTLDRVLSAPRPRARYDVTTPTHIMRAARRVLPTRVLDSILAKGA